MIQNAPAAAADTPERLTTAIDRTRVPDPAGQAVQVGSSDTALATTDIQSLVRANLEAYQHAARGAFAAATERALRSDSALFTAWCSALGKTALPAEADTVAAFIDDQASSKKPATVRRYISSISHMHRAADVANPCDRSVVKLALKRMNKERGVAQRQAEGVTRRLVDRLLHAGGDRLRDLRNRVLLAIAYDTLARRSELVALRVEDLRRMPEGDGTILIRRSKTDQTGIGSVRYLAPDTMRMVEDWVSRAAVVDGPLLRAVTRGSTMGKALSPYDVTRIYKELAAAAGLPLDTVEAISAHSTRVGAAQDMAASDRIELPAIMQAGGWKSPEMVARYTKRQTARRSGAAKLAELQNRIT